MFQYKSDHKVLKLWNIFLSALSEYNKIKLKKVSTYFISQVAVNKTNLYDLSILHKC